jgi:hypothetical protein
MLRSARFRIRRDKACLVSAFDGTTPIQEETHHFERTQVATNAIGGRNGLHW